MATVAVLNCSRCPFCSGVSRSCVLVSIKAFSRNDAREERRKTSFHLEHKGIAPAAEDVNQGIVAHLLMVLTARGVIAG